MISVFCDTNIYLDYLLKRSGEKEASELFKLASTNQIKTFTSSTCLLQIIYFLKKDGFQIKDIIFPVETILSFNGLAEATESVFRAALRSGFPDLEDAVQYYTALQIKGIDYFITSIIKDYKKASPLLPVITSKQFITLYNKK